MPGGLLDSLNADIVFLSTFPRMELLSSGDRLLRRLKGSGEEQWLSHICPHLPQREQQQPRERARVAIQTASFPHMPHDDLKKAAL